jgi:HSP20 family protein
MLREYAAETRLPQIFRDMRRAQDEMNRFFGGLRFDFRSEFPAFNVWAGADGALVTAQVPGVSPDQIDITVHRDTVTLRGKRDPEEVGEEAVVHRRERPHGPFTRTIVLPFRVDANRVSARFERGILALELPRPEDDKPRHIKVANA